MKTIYIIAISLLGVVSTNAQTYPPFSQSADIGNPKVKGSVHYDSVNQSYSITAGGYNIWFDRDEFTYAYQPVAGDFIYTASFSLSANGDPHRKTGWMVRSGTDDRAAHISAVMHGDGLVALQWRALRGAFMRDPEDEIRFPRKKIATMQMERKGQSFIMRVAPFGEPLQEVGRKDFPDMPDKVLIGLFACAHNSVEKITASISNIRLVKAQIAGKDPISRLEVVEVASGHKRIIHEAAARFEAPNYLPDGKSLLFNQSGQLYNIPENGGKPILFSTGSVKRNNNDHGISFDGKQLAMSSHVEGKPGGGSTIYVMPLSGGEPRMVSDKTPSYWHGWSPDGKFVLAIAQRGTPIYDIYRISVKDGSEENLTRNAEGHVDGSEYSPDGKWIYYNGNATGTMQIWRMRPDGSGKEQLTFDEYHNWFPHISPDGKQMVIISFPPDIDPGAHPADKRVMLRIMPANGGAPRVLTSLYGGQGTINVPSWSPDSKRIAFVSYTY